MLTIGKFYVANFMLAFIYKEVMCMKEKYYKIIGENIAYYRKKKHLTQIGLSMNANVSRAYISHLEAKNMNRVPSLDMLFHLCEILDIEPYQLFIEQVEEKEKKK